MHLVKNTSRCLCHVSAAQLLKEDAVISAGKAGRNKKWNIFFKKPKSLMVASLAGDAILQASTAMSKMIHVFMSFNSFHRRQES